MANEAESISKLLKEGKIESMFKLLYHGTTKGYHDMRIKMFSRYESDYAPIIGLGLYPHTPMGYAFQRAKQYDDEPLLLVVKTSKINSNLTWMPAIECEFLEPEWYRTLNLELREGKISEETLKRLKETEELTLKL